MAKECGADDEHEEGDGAEFSDMSTPRDMAAASPQTRKEALKLIKSKGAPPFPAHVRMCLVHVRTCAHVSRARARLRV